MAEAEETSPLTQRLEGFISCPDTGDEYADTAFVFMALQTKRRTDQEISKRVTGSTMTGG